MFGHELVELVDKMLQIDPSKRPTAKDLIVDPWIQAQSKVLLESCLRNPNAGENGGQVEVEVMSVVDFSEGKQGHRSDSPSSALRGSV